MNNIYMEFTKKDIIIYKKLKQKLSRDKIKKLIKNQEEFNLPDDIISVLRKFRMQDTVGGSKGFSTYSKETTKDGKTTINTYSTGSAKNTPSTKGRANNISEPKSIISGEVFNMQITSENDIENDNLKEAYKHLKDVCKKSGWLNQVKMNITNLK